MEQWKFVTILVTIFAFALEVRPMDSFLTAYLTGPYINATLDEVSNVLTPIRIYASVVGTFFVFLLSDFLLYKPVMIFNGLIGILAYICLISPSTFRLKIFEISVSLFTCAEVSYFGYLYAKIKDKELYQTATGYVKAGNLSGKFVSGLSSQLLAFLNHGDYYTLSYYSLASVTFASVWACFLPAVKNNTYFFIEDSVTDKPKKDTSKGAIYDQNIPNYTAEKDYTQNVSRTTTIKYRFKLLYGDFKHSYSNRTVLLWSLWQIFGTALYIEVFLYINILYTYLDDASDGSNTLLNGAVDSISTICGAYCSYQIGKVDVDWIIHGNVFLSLSSLALGLSLSLCFYFKSLFSTYILYIFHATLVQSIFVIVISQIAKELKDDCYSLILGFNSFLSTVLSTFASMFLVYMGTSVLVQFLIYGSIYMGIGVLYGCAAFYQKDITLASNWRFRQLP